MFAKLINGNLEYAPYYLKKDKKDIFNYNAESNSKMLTSDGYKRVVDNNDPPENMKKPFKIWKETDTEIIATWIDDYCEPTLNELKEAKRAEINQARDEAEQGGFEYMGKVFDSDPISCQRISMAAQAMALADDIAKITWTCQDNTTIDLNKTQIVGVVVALAEWSNTCHQKATALKAQIDAAKTAEELEKITWEDKPATLL